MEMNYLVWIAAAVAPMIVGMLWYSDGLFGKQWRKHSHWSDADMKKAKEEGMAKTHLLMFIGVLIQAYVLTMVLNWAGVGTWQEALKATAWVWVGFVAVTQFTGTLWGKNKSKHLFFIDAGYQLVSLLIMAWILFTWM